MARQAIPVQYKITSDLSGVELESDGWSSVKFAVTVDDNPQTYGMADLSIEEREEFLAMLAPYFEAAKRAGNYAEGKAKPASGSGDALQVIRRWAESVTPEKGKNDKGEPEFHTYNVTIGDKEVKLERPATRGRLSQEWKDAYAAFQSESERQDKEAGENASEATLNAAIAAGEESVKPVKAAKGK